MNLAVTAAAANAQGPRNK